MKRSPKRLAIAGLGASARAIHLPACRRIAEIEVVAGCDPAGGGQHFPFPVFASVEEMLARSRAALLTVATPPETHFEIVRLGLEAGCHVVCEKPFMPSLEEARQIVDLARRVGRRVVVNNQYRFMEIHRRARELIGRPEFGDLLFLNAEQTFYRSARTEAGWRGRESRRVCLEFGTHVLDLCRYFFAAEPLTLEARIPPVGGPEEPERLVLLRLEFSGGRAAQVTLDRLSRGRHRYLELRLDGSAGCIETRLGGGFGVGFGVRGHSRRPYFELDASLGGRARLYRGERFRTIATDPLDIFARATGRLLEGFLDALERDVDPPCDAADNLRTLGLALAAYESNRRRETLRLDHEVSSTRDRGEGAER